MSVFHGPDDPVYTISVAARLLGVSPHLLRQFEMEGLITPARTDSNIRLYSDNDLRLLAKIIYLSKDCGINTQGIKVILAMEGDYRAPPRNALNGPKTGLPFGLPAGEAGRKRPGGRPAEEPKDTARDSEDYSEDYAKKSQ